MKKVKYLTWKWVIVYWRNWENIVKKELKNTIRIKIYVTRFGKIRINAATNYFCFFLLTGYTGPEDLDFQVWRRLLKYSSNYG